MQQTQQETSASDIATDKIQLVNANAKTPYERRMCRSSTKGRDVNPAGGEIFHNEGRNNLVFHVFHRAFSLSWFHFTQDERRAPDEVVSSYPGGNVENFRASVTKLPGRVLSEGVVSNKRRQFSAPFRASQVLFLANFTIPRRVGKIKRP